MRGFEVDQIRKSLLSQTATVILSNDGRSEICGLLAFCSAPQTRTPGSAASVYILSRSTCSFQGRRKLGSHGASAPDLSSKESTVTRFINFTRWPILLYWC